VIPADRHAVWRVVSDPYHLPRWWPKVTRVEAVQERRRGTGTLWTKVLETRAGRGVRADFRCTEFKEPSVYGWQQDIEGTPFAKVLRSSLTTIRLDDAEQGGTRVTLEADQRLRGVSRFGGFMLRRATKAQLDEALNGLEHALGPDEGEDDERDG
jgi:uncharacterized protein YndB with AHSA1/START domain